MAEDKKDGVDTIAGTADVKIAPAKTDVVKAVTPKSTDKYEKKEDAIAKQNENPKTQTVSSVAQLRDAAQSQGATVSTEQVAQAREAEEKAAEAGGKKHRLPAHARGKK